MTKSIRQMNREWHLKYPNGRTEEEVRVEFQACLAKIKASGIRPLMSGDELMELFRDGDEIDLHEPPE